MVVAGVALRGRRFTSTDVAGCRIATTEDHFLAGAGAIAAVAAAGTSRTTGVHVDLVSRVGQDEAGTWTLAELIGRGVDISRLSRLGATGESLVVESASAATEVILVPGLIDADGVAPALDSCRAGDVLLLDACVLAQHPETVEHAYDADLQVVADLSPVLPGSLDGGVVERIDVAVVDAAGAGVLADSANPPASTAVYAGGLGSWWDDLRYLPPGPGAGPSPADDGVHRLAGALAAGLAAGMDRPEAFTYAVAVAMQRIEA